MTYSGFKYRIYIWKLSDEAKAESHHLSNSTHQYFYRGMKVDKDITPVTSSGSFKDLESFLDDASTEGPIWACNQVPSSWQQVVPDKFSSLSKEEWARISHYITQSH